MYKAQSNGTLTNETASLVLGRGNDVGQNVSKSFLNKIQSIPFSINTDMVDLLSDTLKPAEEKLSWSDEKNRQRAFKQLVQETDATIDYLLENGNKMWFLWRYDKRSRSYCQGYHINVQGNAYRKAIMELHDTEHLTTEGIKWLKIDIANCYGYDKDVWFKRIMGSNRLTNDIFSDLSTWKDRALEHSADADAPELFLKAIYAFYKGVILGEAIGHDMGLDASASGIQLMSAISGDMVGARNSNICPKEVTEMNEDAVERLAELEAELASL